MAEIQYQTRPLQAADINQVIALDKGIGGEDRGVFFQKRLQTMQRDPETYIAIVAVDNERLCGFLFANVLTGEFGATESVAQIDALGVQPDLQGSGLGEQLMSALKAEAQRCGCSSLRTQVGWHEQQLLGYFAAEGFALAPRTILKRAAEGRINPTVESDFEDGDADQLPPVRSLQAFDLNDISRIDRHIVGEDRTAYLQQKVTEVLTDSGIRISLVGVQDGMVAGFIMARLDYGSFGRTSSTAVIDTVGVGPEYKGSGIGTALMTQLLGNLSSLQVENVRTEVEWENFPLNRFLAGCGFRPAQHLSLSCAL